MHLFTLHKRFRYCVLIKKANHGHLDEINMAESTHLTVEWQVKAISIT